MHDARVAVDLEQVSDVPGAGNRDASEVVAREVHEHDVLGDLLGVSAHLQLVADIQLMRGSARPGAGDGIELHLPVGGRVLEVGFWGGPEEFMLGPAQVEHVRRRVRLTERAVGSESIGTRNTERARGNDLVNIASMDVALEVLHVASESSVIDVGARGDGAQRCG